jgi:molybdopterin synthase catalytic subunit
MTNCLKEGPITQNEITHLMEKMGKRNNSGGHTFFLGQVRTDIVNGKRVKAIEYSAYETMANAEADKIKETVLSEFSDAKSIDIIHSTGIVKAGEISLLVLVSAGHRQNAIQACSKTVELIKRKLPVWKKEIFVDGTYEWK